MHNPPRLNRCHFTRIAKWQNLVKCMPQISGPALFVKVASQVLPDYCTFARIIFADSFLPEPLLNLLGMKGLLVVYIPSLCECNPWYKAIVVYRESCYSAEAEK